MPAAMTDEQLTFWRELCAPFHESQLRKLRRGKELTYVTSRALFNRLDEVAGPDGWTIEYRPTERGYTAKLAILCPTANGSRVWIAKEDGGGFEDMGQKNRDTGEWETDQDNDEKSAYTNAARRVCAAFGMGRYLYGDGVPAWMGGARPGSPPASGPERPSAGAPASTPCPPPSSPNSSNGPTPPGRGGYDNFKFPKPGKGPFAWAKNLETHFETGIVEGMKADAKKRGWPTMFGEWDQEQINAICAGAARYCMSLDNYNGEFDNNPLVSGPGPKTEDDTPAPPPAEAPARDRNELLNEKKRELIAAVKALVTKQVGREATHQEVADAIRNIGAEVANGQGHKGETMESLRECSDGAWIVGMIAFTHDQIRRVGLTPSTDDDIPF